MVVIGNVVRKKQKEAEMRMDDMANQFEIIFILRTSEKCLEILGKNKRKEKRGIGGIGHLDDDLRNSNQPAN